MTMVSKDSVVGGKKGSGFRGGGGICPAKGHGRYLDVNLAEAQDLARVHEGKTRTLASIPKGYRLEATGLRIISDATTGKSVRSFIGVVDRAGKELKPGNRRPVLLEKRTKPEWNGIHVRITDQEKLWVEVQIRDEDAAPPGGQWEDVLEITVDPFEAFKVEDQDVVWFQTDVEANGHSFTVWVELSLMRLTSALMEVFKGVSKGVVKQRQKTKVFLEYAPRKPEDIEGENALIEALRKEKEDSPMSVQDKVHMKDIWNKCLGWIDLTGEFIVDGLFLRCPDLLEIFGKITAELTFDMLISLIDMSVRALNKKTEVVARESYHEMPLSEPEEKPFRTLEEGFKQFAQLGMKPKHWQEARAIFVLAMKNACPYLEEADAEILDTGVDSCAYKFWTQQIMLPAICAIKDLNEIFDSKENHAILQAVMDELAGDHKAAGRVFYQVLLSRFPELLPFFGTTDMNFLAGHLFDAVDLLVNSFNDFDRSLPHLHHLGKIHDNARIPCWSYPSIVKTLEMTFRNGKIYDNGTPEGDRAVLVWDALMQRSNLCISRISFVSERLLRKAFEWSEQVAQELKWDELYLSKRKAEIEAEIRSIGTYTHTEEEVVHGARVSWRNSAKCVGRIAWNTMLVRDRRHVTNLDHIFAECVEHQRLATADGSLKAVMTVFKPRQPGTRLGMRFWGLQLIRFACYEMPDGTFMGDKANRGYTKDCIEFGWKPPEPRTEFDVLPVVIEDTVSGTTKLFEVPKEYHKVTMIEHPKFPKLKELGLRWCVVPTVICFTMKLGGLDYTCCPFNGWFMETEITRDLLEPGRMDKMTAIAEAIGVDPTDEDDFWRERVALETNKAVVYSFRRDGNSIVDHVTAQAQFLAHDLREKREGRECPAQWSWVVPSSGGATMPVWHHEMRDFYVEPQYLYQAELMSLRALSGVPETELLTLAQHDFAFEKILILYASVTGTAEGYAYKAKKLLKPLQVDVKGCEKVDVKTLWKEFTENGGPYSALVMIVSTFGEGDPPTNAVEFYNDLKGLPLSALSGVKYSVMAIGSRVYPDFCQAGVDFDYQLGQRGAEQFLPLSKGDELEDQPGAVEKWIASVASYFDVEQKKALVLSGDLPSGSAVTEEGPPVVVTELEEGSDQVKAALAQEKDLAAKGHAEAALNVGTLGRFLPADYVICPVTRNSELVNFSNPGSEDVYKSTRFLEFDLHGIDKDGVAKTLTYTTGDHAKIVPCNAPDVVRAMCSCLKLSPDTWVEVKIQEGEARPLSTPVARVGDILSMEIDLATQDSDGSLPLFERLLEIARTFSRMESENLDEGKKSALETELAGLESTTDMLKKNGHGPKEAEALEAGEDLKKKAIASVIENFMDVPSLLAAYPVVATQLTLADCIEVLPRQKPRYYSIASSSELHPSRLQLTVGVLKVSYKATQRVRNGICSNYLAGTKAAGTTEFSSDSFIRIGINPSSFRLPANMGSPIIMVGPGTGISPMLGFLQAREKAQSDGVTLGPCMVFFGCRSRDDFLHSEQLEAWEMTGVITSLQVAFSRLPGHSKEYVQHRISKIRREVWDILKDENCHYYICGDSNMAEDVYEELFQTARFALGEHGLAWSFFQRMKEEHRFQADTWGVVMNRKEGLAKQADKKYNMAEQWLKSMEDKEDGEVVERQGSQALPVKISRRASRIVYEV